jgi:hypothetical protein
MNSQTEAEEDAPAAEPTALFAAFDQADSAGKDPELVKALHSVFLSSAQESLVSELIKRYARPYAVWMYVVRMAQRPSNYIVAIALTLIVLSFLPDRPIENQPQRQQQESINVQ